MSRFTLLFPHSKNVKLKKYFFQEICKGSRNDSYLRTKIQHQEVINPKTPIIRKCNYHDRQHQVTKYNWLKHITW